MSQKNIKFPTAQQLASGLTISTGEARKILGKETANLSDDQVANFILDLTDFAQLLLKDSHSKK